jgi:hypothetical protein
VHNQIRQVNGKSVMTLEEKKTFAGSLLECIIKFGKSMASQ